jgi:hypothetical protein
MVGTFGLEHVVDDDEQGVGDGDQRALDPASTREPTKLRPNLGGLTARVGPRDLT